MLNGMAILIITIFYIKRKILITVTSKSVENVEVVGVCIFAMDCNGSDHIIGLVTSLSLIR